MTKLSITITEERTVELIEKYATILGVKPAQVISLAIRRNLPEVKLDGN